MTSLYLPAPKRSGNRINTNLNKNASSTTTITTLTTTNDIHSNKSVSTTTSKPPRAPSYEERCKAASNFAKLPPSERKLKKLFVPRSIADFDDGGSFPEIHVAQYPRHMGNPHLKKNKSNNAASAANKKNSLPASASVGSSSSTTQSIVNVTVDSDGNKDYTALIKSGTNASKKVYTSHTDLKGYTPTAESLSLPSHSEEQSTASKTQAAIDALLSSKIALSKPSGTAIQNASTSQNQESKTQFISYTPNPNAPGYNPQAAPKRIIQMVPAQLDPMMPPKHKHEKAPPGPAEDFTPVLHAPPEKLTKEERDAWNVPACISNWKNTRGYTIPLDKRLAADGRGLRDDTTINSNFATLSESLYLAERNAREEVRMRALVKKRQVEGERDRREKELRELAMRAREERGSGGGGGRSEPNTLEGRTRDDDEDDESFNSEQNESNRRNDYRHHDDESKPPMNVIPPSEEEEISKEAEQRDRIRQERRRERERELRMERQKPNRRNNEDDNEVSIKKARLGDRDISEKIALGVHTGSGGGDGGGIDGRLYNQSAGLDSGFGADDEYNTYSKPMFDRDGVTSSSIYRPSRGEGAMDADAQYDQLKSGATARFQPDRGFKGAEGGNGMASTGGPRNAPVQFEKGH